MGFGDFTTICAKASIPLCALVGHQEINGGAGIQTKCYARTIEIANTLIFQAANDFMHILALIMTVVMIIHVRSKFTAVGMLRHYNVISRCESTLMHMNRPQRDHIFLLYLLPPYHCFTHPRCRCRCARVRRLSVFRRRTEWSCLSALHQLVNQRFRGISAVRGRYHPVCLAAAIDFSRHVHHRRRHFPPHFQKLGRS